MYKIKKKKSLCIFTLSAILLSLLLTYVPLLSAGATEVDSHNHELEDVFLYGDINDDIKIDVGDAISVLRYIVGLSDLTSLQILAADVNRDGTSDVKDAILILRHIVGLQSRLPLYVVPETTGNLINIPGDYATIQEGIDNASDGDLIIISPGTYTENINFLGKSITVASEAGPELTTIDGDRQGSVVTFHNEESSNSVLHGFTITNGLTIESWSYGGGISIKDASPVISEVKVYKNASGELGAGIYVQGEQANPVIKHSIIADNLAQYQGGGLEVRDGAAPLIFGNIIYGNIAEAGGGINVANAAAPVIKNNIIRDNVIGFNFYDEHLIQFLDGTSVTDRDDHQAFPGGILVVQNSSPRIESNRITRNAGGGIGVMLDSEPLINNNFIESNSNEDVGAVTGGLLVALGSNPEIRNNTIWGNKGPAIWIDDTSLINDIREKNLINDENQITGDVFLWPLLPPEKEEPASGQIINVPGTSNLTIQEAIEEAQDGDTIIVATGNYNESLDFLGKIITVISEDPTDLNVVEATVIETDGPHPTVYFTGGETRDAVLEGFTIRSQNTDGIYISNSSPTIANNIITAYNGIYMNHPYVPLYDKPSDFNSAPGFKTAPLIKGNTIRDNTKSGISFYYASPEITDNLITGNGKESDNPYGGIWAWFSHPVITDNTVTNNIAAMGGGIYFENFCRPEIRSNLISGNTALLGGGIYFDSPSYAIIDSNEITNNDAMPGGGITVNFGASPLITNNLIVSNTGGALGVGGVSQPVVINNTFAENYQKEGEEFTQGIFIFGNAKVKVINTIFYYSDLVIYYEEYGEIIMNNSLLFGGTANEDDSAFPYNKYKDPLFVGDGDYRLQEGSPCIDAGATVDLDTDKDGNGRPQGEGFDMGAYEYNR